QADQFLFVQGLDAAAGDGNRIGGNELKSRSSLPQMIVKGEQGSFFDADAAGAQTMIRQQRCRQLCRALVLLPDVHFGRETKLLTEAAFFKSRANHQWVALLQDENTRKALARPPVHTGEVIVRASRSKKESIKLGILFRQKPLHPRNAPL